MKNMDELTLLCAQEFVDELMDTASSDESEEKQQNMSVLTLLCAQQLIDDLLESSSSSDDDDECFSILSYAKLLERSGTISKHKDDITVPTSSYQKQSPKAKEVNSFSERLNTFMKQSSPTTILAKSGNGVKEVCRENSDHNEFIDFDFGSMFKQKEIATILAKHDVETKSTTSANDVSSRFTKCDNVKSDQKGPTRVSIEDKAKDSKLPFCNFQDSPFDESIINSLTENEFKHYFNISRRTVTYLFDKFLPWYYKCYEHSAENFNMKTTMLSFLWFCANPVTLESVARMFNASLGGTKRYFNIILDFFEKELAEEMIKLPSSYSEKEAIAKDFEKIEGFPNVLGCLSECYMNLKIPELIQACGGSQLYLRGVCDSNMKFLNVKIGYFIETNYDIFLERDLPKLCFPKYHLLGEAKCTIRDHLIIPYENDKILNESEKYFNTKFYRTHVKIKNAFSILRNRFRQFNYLDFNSFEILSKFIVACCILHNICIDRQDFFNDETYKDESSNHQLKSSLSTVKCNEFLIGLGLMKRQELTQVFSRTKK